VSTPGAPLGEASTADTSRLADLEICLIAAARAIDVDLTPSDLSVSESGVKSAFEVRDAVRVLDRFSVAAWFGEAPLDQIDELVLPAVLMLEDGRAIAVLARSVGAKVSVVDPRFGTAAVERDLADFKDHYSGYALLLRRRATEDLAKSGRLNSDRHWFWSAFTESRWVFAQVFLAAALTNVLGLASSIFIMVVYDRVLPNEAIESLLALTAGMGLALLFDFLIKSLRATFIDGVGQRADKAMGQRIFEHLLFLPMAQRRGSTGGLSSTLREFETVREFFTSATLILFVDLPFIILFIWVIYLVGGPLALVPAIALPIVLLLGFAVQPSLARLAQQNLNSTQSKQSVLVETVAGLETVKTVGAGRMLRGRWESAVQSHSDFGLRSRAISQFAMNGTMFVQQAAQIMIIFLGFFLVQAGTVSMGALIASVILTGRALGPLGQLAQAITRLNQVRSAYKSLDAIMQMESERPFGRRWLQRDKIEGQVSFENVDFDYPDSSISALRACSFALKAGERVAIVGKIGSGKSTIARLLLGLYPPGAGTVRIDGADIRQFDPEQLRDAIGAVLQDTWLFTGTIRENIAVGARRASDTEVKAAAELAGVDQFVRDLPDGYDTVLSERGEGLSGGQRQAICLARAFVSNPSILVLDEPTSAIDVRSEDTLIDRLEAYTKGRTVILITHRPSLLRLVDRVIVLENGKIVADKPSDQVTARKVGAAP